MVAIASELHSSMGSPTTPRADSALFSNLTPSATVARYTFTPKALTKVPRAWERKPSTPFAPRTESQKIWKRQTSREVKVSGTGQKDRGRATRALKRLRLDKTTSENTTVHVTSWDEEQHEARHKQSAPQVDRRRSTSPHATPLMAIHDIRNESQQVNEALPHLLPGPSATDTTHENATIEGVQTVENAHAQSPSSPVHRFSPKPERPGAEQDENTKSSLEITVEPGAIPLSQSGTSDAAASPMEDEDGTEEKRDEEVQHAIVQNVPETEVAAAGAAEDSADEAAAAQMHTGLEDSVEERGPDSEELLNDGRGQAESPDISEDRRTDLTGSPTEDDAPGVGLDTAVAPEIIPADTVGSEEEAEEENVQPENISQQLSLMPTNDQSLKPSTSVHDEDTDYLHAFLTRARAKKAIREASPEKVNRVAPSPLTRSRAALMPISPNKQSPTKAKGQDTSIDASQESEQLDETKTSSPCRRSGRTRLPRPQKAPVVNPSTIPVRSSNGTEFVFLQRTDAQQIALATRSNTKRNKGEALMPKVKLQALSERQKSPSKSPVKRKAGGKEVSWNDQPSYLGPQMEEKREEEIEEQPRDVKPKAKKVRRPGTVNGTPAPKRVMAEEDMDLTLPLPKKRGKVRSA